ncbi:MAG TPA: hypothetical protein VFR62_07675 [Gemmatimonadales bacterium]|nr:hypothetical protein [Gemmatimonadales bacterium]
MRSRLAGVAQILGLIVLLLGCGSRSEEGAEAEPEPEHTAEVALEVENHSWSDIVISLVRGTAVERLGMVGALNSETFVFPYRKLGVGTDVRLRAYPIGGPSAFTSENVLVQPGQWVKWTLESDLTRSFLAVY